MPASFVSPAAAQYAPSPASPAPPASYAPPASNAPPPGYGTGTGIAAPVEGMLLLKNGETLAGRISAAGDFYIVVAENTELQVRTRDIEAVCRNLDDAVAHKASKLNPRSAEDHLGLAQWCIDRGLYDIAARELTVAYRIDDTHPRIVLLERRMKAAMSAPRVLPPPPKPVAPAVDDATVARALAGVSTESVHDFTVRVQPLMMNYCATAGCHGPKPKSEFHLERVYLNELNDSRVVRRNLYAVLKQIDRKAPATSKLLTMPLTPHGGGKNAIFHAHNAEHYRQLAIWVGKVAAAAPAEASAPAPTTAAASTPTDPLLQRLPIAPPGSSAANPPPPVGETPSGPATAASTPALAGGAPPPPAERPAVDPFDPELFNRRRGQAPP